MSAIKNTPDKGPGQTPDKKQSEVRSLIDHLTDAFGPVEDEMEERSWGFRRDSATSAEGEYIADCIAPILEGLNLYDMSERVAEAMPHLEKIRSVEDLLAILYNLGFAAHTRMMLPSEPTDDHIPALIVSANGDVSVAIGHMPDGRLRLFDPRTGTESAMELSAEPLEVTTFEPARPAADDGRKENWFWTALGRMKRSVATVIVLTFAANSLSILLPLYVMMVYNNVVATQSLDSLLFLSVGIISAIATELALKNIRTKLIARAGARFVSAVSTAAFAQLLQLPIHMTQSAPIARQIARFRQFESLKDFFTGHLATAVFDLPFTFVFLLVIGFVGGQLVWVPVVLMAVMGLVGMLTAAYNKILNDQASEARARAQSFQIETLSNAETVIDIGGQEIWLARYKRYLHDAMRAKYRAGVVNMTLHALAQMLVMIAGVATLTWGAVGVIAGDLTMGALIACMLIVWRVLSPVQVAFLSLNRIAQFASSIRQINQLMRLKVETDHLRGVRIQRRHVGSYRLDRVMFRYPSSSEFVLRGLTLRIERGEMIAVAGSSAAGKSTLLRMLLGLHMAQSGLIALDDVDMRQLDPRDVRRSIGYLPQELNFFHGTIAQNMRLALPSATDKEIVDALNLAGVDFVAEQFPDGINTRLTGMQWSALPTGQLQLLGLARAYVKKAPILLLDEPGTFLDREGDRRFLDSISMFQEKATIVMSTNRPSHMRKCDRVIYMRDGTVLADGDPEEIVPKIEQSEALRSRQAIAG